MLRTLFVNHQSLVSYNSIHVIYFENCWHMVFHSNFHPIEPLYFDCPDRIVAIYRQMESQFYYWSAHTIPNGRWIFQSNKLAHFWVVAALFLCYNWFASLKFTIIIIATIKCVTLNFCLCFFSEKL